MWYSSLERSTQLHSERQRMFGACPSLFVTSVIIWHLVTSWSTMTTMISKHSKILNWRQRVASNHGNFTFSRLTSHYIIDLDRWTPSLIICLAFLFFLLQPSFPQFPSLLLLPLVVLFLLGAHRSRGVHRRFLHPAIPFCAAQLPRTPSFYPLPWRWHRALWCVDCSLSFRWSEELCSDRWSSRGTFLSFAVVRRSESLGCSAKHAPWSNQLLPFSSSYSVHFWVSRKFTISSLSAFSGRACFVMSSSSFVLAWPVNVPIPFVLLPLVVPSMLLRLAVYLSMSLWTLWGLFRLWFLLWLCSELLLLKLLFPQGHPFLFASFGCWRGEVHWLMVKHSKSERRTGEEKKRCCQMQNQFIEVKSEKQAKNSSTCDCDLQSSQNQSRGQGRDWFLVLWSSRFANNRQDLSTIWRKNFNAFFSTRFWHCLFPPVWHFLDSYCSFLESGRRFFHGFSLLGSASLCLDLGDLWLSCEARLSENKLLNISVHFLSLFCLCSNACCWLSTVRTYCSLRSAAWKLSANGIFSWQWLQTPGSSLFQTAFGTLLGLCSSIISSFPSIHPPFTVS